MTDPAVYRADRFLVPVAAATRFLDRIRRTHSTLDAADGCLLNLVLTRELDDDTIEVLTVVNWRDAASLSAAREAMQAAYAAEGFSSSRFMQELGIDAQLGDFRSVPLG